MSTEQYVPGSKLALAGFASVFLIAMSSAQASVIATNWSFETLSGGDPIVSTNGASAHGMWEGSPFSPTNHAAEAVALTYTQPLGGYPLPNETHNIAMQILGDVSNRFDMPLTTNPVVNLPAGPTNVWIDMVVSPGQLSFQPDTPVDAQLAAYVNTNGMLVVRHSYYEAGYNGGFRVWSELSHTPIATGDFVRLSVKMTYIDPTEVSEAGGGNPNPGQNWFQIYLDGVALESTNAYSSSFVNDQFSAPNGAPDTGPWFLAADSGYFAGASPNNNYLSAIAFSGAGIVDDINVAEMIAPFSTNTPSLTPFETWLQGNSIAINDGSGDEDGDGTSNWAEYVAGTDPNDPNSVFAIVRQEFNGPTNCIWWVIGTETNLSTDFIVWRATNIAEVSPWTVVASNLTRSASGTNVWYDSTPPALPAFYRPGLLAPPAP